MHGRWHAAGGRGGGQVHVLDRVPKDHCTYESISNENTIDEDNLVSSKIEVFENTGLVKEAHVKGRGPSGTYTVHCVHACLCTLMHVCPRAPAIASFNIRPQCAHNYIYLDFVPLALLLVLLLKSLGGHVTFTPHALFSCEILWQNGSAILYFSSSFSSGFAIDFTS